MTEEVMDISKLRLEQSVRRFRMLVATEVVIIVGLIGWLSAEYQNNQFMRAWVQQNFWPLDYVLNGYLVAVIGGFMIGWAVTNYRSRRSRDQAILDALRRLI